MIATVNKQILKKEITKVCERLGGIVCDGGAYLAIITILANGYKEMTGEELVDEEEKQNE